MDSETATLTGRLLGLIRYTRATRHFLTQLPLADPSLRTELTEALTETTDDGGDPWTR